MICKQQQAQLAEFRENYLERLRIEKRDGELIERRAVAERLRLQAEEAARHEAEVATARIESAEAARRCAMCPRFESAVALSVSESPTSTHRCSSRFAIAVDVTASPDCVWPMLGMMACASSTTTKRSAACPRDESAASAASRAPDTREPHSRGCPSSTATRSAR